MAYTTDPIADLLTRIRNASRALLPTVEMPHSRIKEDIAHILKKEGFVGEVTVDGKVPKKSIKIKLKYEGKKNVIEGLKRVSSPGLRRYVGSTEIPRVLGGMCTSILSTPRGILSGREAKKQNVGGELLAYVW
jgi:small subunit ribosomal protein S8